MNASTTVRTPGPWFIEITPSGCCDMICGEEGERVCEFPYGATDGRDKLNAEFIVQACNAHDDLVAALRDLLPLAECYARDNAEYAWRERIDAARAALSKVTTP